MHGPGLGTGAPDSAAFSLPFAALAASDRCSKAAEPAIPAKQTPRSGLSLLDRGCPFPSLRSRINVPGLLLRRRVECGRQARSASDSAPRFARRINTRCPLPGACIGAPNSSSRLRSRPGHFYPCRSLRYAIDYPDAYLEGTPDARHSPLAGALFWPSPVDLRSGLASFLLAYCSVDLLEPHPSCTGFDFQSTAKRRGYMFFRNFFPARNQ